MNDLRDFEEQALVPVLESLLAEFMNSHAPSPLLHREEKNYISISEIMSFLNVSAGRIDPQSHFDAESVINWLRQAGYRQEIMGAVLHFQYY